MAQYQKPICDLSGTIFREVDDPVTLFEDKTRDSPMTNMRYGDCCHWFTIVEMFVVEIAPTWSISRDGHQHSTRCNDALNFQFHVDLAAGFTIDLLFSHINC